MQPRRRAEAGAVQHRRPEQAVEVDDVLADEVVQLGLAVVREVAASKSTPSRSHSAWKLREVADRRVQPDVEVLARMAGDLEAEVGRVARDVPGAQAAFGVEPFQQLGLDARAAATSPASHSRRKSLEAADLEEEVLRLAQLRRRAADSTERGSFSSVGA